MKLSGALNRILSLLPMKTGSKQTKKDQVQSQAVLASPRRPRSDVGGGRSQPHTPALREVSLQACPGEGTGAGHRPWLKDTDPSRAPPFWGANPTSAQGLPYPLVPPAPPPPMPGVRSQAVLGTLELRAGDLVSRQLTLRWGRRGGDTWEVWQHPQEGNVQVQITSFHLEGHTGRTPGEVLRASEQRIDSACAVAGLLPWRGDLNHSFLESTPKKCRGTNTASSTRELPWLVLHCPYSKIL